MRLARSLAVVGLVGLACRFDSDGAETGGSGTKPAGPSDDGDDDVDAETTGDTSSEADDGEADDGGDASSGATDEGVMPPPDDPCPRIRVMVSPGGSLNVRPTPSTQGEPLYELPNNAIVDRIADVQGEWVGETDTWYEITIDELAESGFVSSNYATCTTAEPPSLYPPDGHWLPLECDTSATISQGNDGSFSHQGNAFYAFDFSIGVGTPLVAMADGIVIHRYAATGPGEPCYDGGGEECYPYANLVVLLHGDGFTSIYKHLSDVQVAEGEFVPRGHVVGLSGSSGYSTGPHAHVARQEDCGEANCQSVPLEFAEIGVPQTGDQVTSNNCP